MPSVDLLETLKWTPAGGFVLLERHLERLRASAAYFDYLYNRPVLQSALDAAVADSSGALRVRLLLSRDGRAMVEHRPFEPGPDPVGLRLATSPVGPRDVWLFHKTTCRGVYERARRSDADDTVLWNPGREVTETTTANVVAEIEGERRTPPVESGLLAGTFRAEMLAEGRIREEVVTVDDIRRATRLWVINSVHGWREARLIEDRDWRFRDLVI